MCTLIYHQEKKGTLWKVVLYGVDIWPKRNAVFPKWLRSWWKKGKKKCFLFCPKDSWMSETSCMSERQHIRKKQSWSIDWLIDWSIDLSRSCCPLSYTVLSFVCFSLCVRMPCSVITGSVVGVDGAFQSPFHLRLPGLLNDAALASVLKKRKKSKKI